jgi:hypothetical protein
MKLFVAMLAMCWLAFPCAAEVQLSLPLEGYYRPGRYMPVRLVVRGEGSGPLKLTAEGAVPVWLDVGSTGNAIDVTVPLLVVRAPLGPLSWSLPNGRSGRLEARLTPLGEEDRLVAHSGTDAADAASLFPGKTIVPIALDLAAPLQAPRAVMAWEVLDGLVVDRAPGNHQVSFLTVGGTAVVVRSATAPEPGWLQWQWVGKTWVMFQPPAGPRGVVVPAAYDAASGWNPGRPPHLRRQALLLAAVFAIVVVGLTLWRSRLAVAAVVALSVVATGALVFWTARQSTVEGAGGTVLVRRGGLFQGDEWVYFKSLAPAAAEFPCYAGTKPIFSSAEDVERTGMRLECNPDGIPLRFTFRLQPDATIAFLTRMALARSDMRRPDPEANGSRLWPLVRQAYLGSGTRAAGETDAASAPFEPDPWWAEEWPDVVVEGAVEALP